MVRDERRARLLSDDSTQPPGSGSAAPGDGASDGGAAEGAGREAVRRLALSVAAFAAIAVGYLVAQSLEGDPTPAAAKYVIPETGSVEARVPSPAGGDPWAILAVSAREDRVCWNDGRVDPKELEASRVEATMRKFEKNPGPCTDPKKLSRSRPMTYRITEAPGAFVIAGLVAPDVSRMRALRPGSAEDVSLSPRKFFLLTFDRQPISLTFEFTLPGGKKVRTPVTGPTRGTSTTAAP